MMPTYATVRLSSLAPDKMLIVLVFLLDRVHLSNMLSASSTHLYDSSVTERLDEVAELLATALLRARAAKSTPVSADHGEKFVDLSGQESGHAPVTMQRKTAR